MQKEVIYGMRKDTFLADMPIEPRDRTEIWRTQKTKAKRREKIVEAVSRYNKLPD